MSRRTLTETIIFQCDEDDKGRLMLLSRESRMTMSAYMRKLITDAFDAHRKAKTDPLDDDDDWIKVYEDEL